MKLSRLASLVLYAGVPLLAYAVLARHASARSTILVDVALATLPMVLLASITWRLVWPRWKLLVKVLLHPCIYAILSAYVGHWSVLVAWVHQGVLGLGVHIWFCRRHGFTWYAVEDPERYVSLSKQLVTSSAPADPSPPA